MSFIERILDAINLSDRDDEDFDEFSDDDYENQLREEKARNRKAKKEKEFEDIKLEEPAAAKRPQRSRPNNIVPLTRNAKGLEVCVVKPSTTDDAKEIVDTLLKGRAVIINLEGIHVEVAQRIIDVSFGACYAIDGNLNKVTEYVFIVTPHDVELSGDLLEAALAGDKLDSVSFKL